MNSPVYMDYNASSPIRAEAAAAAGAALQLGGNPSSVHGFGRAARRVMEDAREQVGCIHRRCGARDRLHRRGHRGE